VDPLSGSDFGVDVACVAGEGAEDDAEVLDDGDVPATGSAVDAPPVPQPVMIMVAATVSPTAYRSFIDPPDR
jgi:hypothetical protein